MKVLIASPLRSYTVGREDLQGLVRLESEWGAPAPIAD